MILQSFALFADFIFFFRRSQLPYLINAGAN